VLRGKGGRGERGRTSFFYKKKNHLHQLREGRLGEKKKKEKILPSLSGEGEGSPSQLSTDEKGRLKLRAPRKGRKRKGRSLSLQGGERDRRAAAQEGRGKKKKKKKKRRGGKIGGLSLLHSSGKKGENEPTLPIIGEEAAGITGKKEEKKKEKGALFPH